MISINETAGLLNTSHQTANALIKKLEEMNILQEITGYDRNKLYLFERYFNLFIK